MNFRLSPQCNEMKGKIKGMVSLFLRLLTQTGISSKNLKILRKLVRICVRRAFQAGGTDSTKGCKVEAHLVYSKNSKRTSGATKCTVSKGKTVTTDEVRKGFEGLDSHEAL